MNKISIYIDGNNLYRSAKELGFENEHYHKFSKKLQKEKAPDADGSA